MQNQTNPFLRLSMLAGGLFLVYLGGTALISSRYVSQGVLDTSWYVQSIGALVSGLALTLGPQLKTLITDAAKQLLPQLFHNLVPVVPVTPVNPVNPVVPVVPVNPVNPVVPVPTPTPTPPGPANINGWLNSLLGGELPALMVQSPEANFLTLLLLAKFAKSVGNDQLLASLRTSAMALFDTFFPPVSKDAPNVANLPVDNRA